MGKFKFIETGIEGLVIVEPTVFGDNRGYFMETYNYNEFADAGLDMVFVQDNQSKSQKRCAARAAFPEEQSPGQAGACRSGRGI